MEVTTTGQDSVVGERRIHQKDEDVKRGILGR